MKTESTSEINEVEGHPRANEYLKAGWVLLGHYLTDNGIPGMGANQQAHYILAWQREDAVPAHPQRPQDAFSDDSDDSDETI